MKLSRISLVALSGAALVSCTTTQQQWGLGGAVAGGAAGAILGDDSSDVLRGAAIGGAAGTGAAVYRERQNGTPTTVSPNQQIIPSQPVQPAAPKVRPTATVTNVPGIVVSPYPPYNKVNVTGFKSGTKAADPYTKDQAHKGIFIVP